VVVHDAHHADPSYAFAISRLQQQDSRFSPMGVFRSVQKPSYDRLLNDQLAAASAKAALADGNDDSALQSLIYGKDTWSVA
jgi:2-oxoglutarate ferredoxin oxidoreductase subunit beta